MGYVSAMVSVNGNRKGYGGGGDWGDGGGENGVGWRDLK